MKKLLFTIALIACFKTGFSQPYKHVILITIDGMRPDFYLDDAWNTPNLKMMRKNGFHAKGVNSVFPSMTYPSHTTIVTGVQPATHGIYYNGMFERDTVKGKIYWNISSTKVPTVWKAAHDKGLKVASLFWPVSADAPVDYNIPDNGSMGEANRIAYSKPAGFIDDLKKNVFKDTSKIDYGTDQNVAKIAAYVIEKDAPALMTIHFFSVDHFEHMEGRQGEAVETAVADADSGVGIILDAIKKKGIADNTLLIVTGDHGFVDVKTSMNPNVWLAKAGLIKNAKNGDWKAKFNSVGGSSFLYLKDRNDKATLARVMNILKAQPDSVKKYYRIIDRKKMEEIGGNPDVEFALTGENNASFGNNDTGEAIKPGKGGAHGYFPDSENIKTGFLAFGKGVAKGASVKEMNEQDINAVIVKALGLSLPTSTGKVPAGLWGKGK